MSLVQYLKRGGLAMDEGQRRRRQRDPDRFGCGRKDQGVPDGTGCFGQRLQYVGSGRQRDRESPGDAGTRFGGVVSGRLCLDIERGPLGGKVTDDDISCEMDPVLSGFPGCMSGTLACRQGKEQKAECPSLPKTRAREFPGEKTPVKILPGRDPR